MREPEPFRIKMVEPIRRTTRSERARIMDEVGCNLFAIRSRDVTVDLLTDSGTGAMSAEQWASMMRGDESYAGSRSFERFQSAVEDVMGFEHVVPTHQGRAAEHLYLGHVLTPDSIVVSNGHFDTTRAHVEITEAMAIDLPAPEAGDPQVGAPFKGNIDLDRLREVLSGDDARRVACVIITITNNTGGGQPVSMENIQQASELARDAGVPLVFDAARFAENAFFIKQRESGYAAWSIQDIVSEMMGYADVVLMSAKKDGLVNIGGLIAVRDEELHARLAERAIVFEGFPTYGGLAGRDIDALATGLREVLDEDYLQHRIGQVAHLGDLLDQAGVPVMRPSGGHAIYVDAGRLLPHVAPSNFPAQALGCKLYVEGGIRGVEIGSNMAGRDPSTGANRHPALELLRLAVPRRTYTYSHLEYVAEVLEQIAFDPQSVPPLEMTYEAPVLRHFTARFRALHGDAGGVTLDTPPLR